MKADEFFADDTTPETASHPEIAWMKVSINIRRFSHMGEYWHLYGISEDGREWQTEALYVDGEFKIMDTPEPAQPPKRPSLSWPEF